MKYVKGYTGFDSKNPDGNFLVLKIGYPKGAEVKVTIVGGNTKDMKMPEDDHQLVVKVKNKEQKIKLDITVDGKTGTVTYDLSGLTLDPNSEAA